MEEVKNNEWIEWLQTIVTALILAFLMRMFVFDVVLVEGSSMHPTLESGDRLIVFKLGYKFGHPDHGDIVVFKNPDTPGINYIKRVIGIEGDTVEIKDGKVYVNGKELVEPYIAEPTLGEYPKTVVPEGTIFVMGDNRNFSRDSRNSHVGFIPLQNVIGKAKIRIWPVWDVTIFK